MKSLLLRAPLAVMLGSMVFAVGLVRLVVFSTRVTTHVMRGDSPDQTLRRLQHERARRTFVRGKSSLID